MTDVVTHPRVCPSSDNRHTASRNGSQPESFDQSGSYKPNHLLSHLTVLFYPMQWA
ncbi:hypothetical protein [Micrococcus sp. TA1]|uniref:hypothetical protein n=1 Tax=Micrococcus sp. TA1 TaxID=681627 RepID=UPI0016072336|nr:hypothetical protein [Micrococcus sp. TA1]MBB5747952.1 hypothetical protein [Micrococcus sp. TA1]